MCGGAIRALSAATVALVITLTAVAVVAAQEATPPPATSDARLAVPVDEADVVSFTYANRPITHLRAKILDYTPADRARASTAVLDQLVEARRIEAVNVDYVKDVALLRVGQRHVLTLVSADLDALAGETLQQRATDAAAALTLALLEADEIRSPARLASAAVQVVGATLLAAALIYGLGRLRRRVSAALVSEGERLAERVARGSSREPAARLARFLDAAVTVLALGVAAFIAYSWLTFSLRRFPYTRPWGESLRSQLLGLLVSAGTSILQALPGLCFVIIVAALTNLLVRISNAFFESVEQGRTQVAWTHPDTAGATRRLVALLLWLFALIVSYPYLPGSGTDAFKGVSVFLGLVISLGSSGIVNQLMSGLTLTYSRAIAIGDAVSVGGVDGTVVSLGLLSAKVKTARDEEVTIPNAVIVGQSATNHSRLAPQPGASVVTTTVTIGYDTPWRQVAAMLVLAAERTPGVMKSPAPYVLKETLDDFYIGYRLLAWVAPGERRPLVKDALLSNVLDTFNEFGVQIMSPHYENDPSGEKVVPRTQWHAAPAPPADERGA